MAAGQRVTTLSTRLPFYLSGGSVAWEPVQGVALISGFVDSPRTLARFDPRNGSFTTTQMDWGSSGHGMVHDPLRGELFLFGGRDAGTALDRIWRHDPGNGRERELDRLASGRTGTSSCADLTNGDLYIFGGKSGGRSLSEIVVVSRRSTSDKQVRLLPVELPSPRFNAASAWDPVRRKAYIFGGQESYFPNVREILEFDPYASGGPSLTVIGWLEHAVAGAGAVWDAHRGKILLFGGKSEYAGHVVEFDPATRTTRVLADRLPRDVVRPNVEVAGTDIWVFGGVDFDPVADVTRFDPTRPEGSRIRTDSDSLPLPNHAMGTYWDARDHVFYMIGGSRSPRSLLRFDPAASRGQQMQQVRTLDVDVIGTEVFFDPEMPLPLMIGSQVDGYADAVTFLTWD